MKLLPLLVLPFLACSPAPDPDLAGTWYGPATASFQGLNPLAYQAALVLSVSGPTVSVASICPDGSGLVSTEGSGNTVEWSGSLACPAVPIAGCNAVAITYKTASLTLNGNGTLSVQGAGESSGCSTARALVMTFTGAK